MERRCLAEMEVWGWTCWRRFETEVRSRVDEVWSDEVEEA